MIRSRRHYQSASTDDTIEFAEFVDEVQATLIPDLLRLNQKYGHLIDRFWDFEKRLSRQSGYNLGRLLEEYAQTITIPSEGEIKRLDGYIQSFIDKPYA